MNSNRLSNNHSTNDNDNLHSISKSLTKMAASTGGDDIQGSTSGENTSKQPNSLQQNSEKGEDVSTNGTVSCSSFMSGSKSTSVLRPSVFSSNLTAGTPIPVFGSTVSSSHFGNNPLQHFANTSQKNPFSLRPSVFGSVSSPENKDLAPKRPVILRASQLEPVTDSPVSSTTASNANCSFVLSPARLNNPFLKTTSKTEDSSSCLITSTSPGKSIDSSQEPEKANSSNCVSEIPKVSFVPLASSTSTNNSGTSQTPASSGTASTVPSFVFGQNLHERVEGSTEAESSDAVTSDASTCDNEVSKTNGTTPEMLFSSVIQRDLPDKHSEIGNDERKRKSLSEAAREYEESRAIKRKYEEVTVKTGEEEEINILQINCKLFAFNKDKSTWVERGRGTLRLNDLSMDNRTQSRVVMRVSGSLRVVLNTKIWAEMTVDRPSEKSVRLTAMDSSSEIKVFLVMAGVKEIDQLYKALEWRVNNQKKLASASEKNLDTNES